MDYLLVAAAGNFFGQDIDVFPFFPAAYGLPNISPWPRTTTTSVRSSHQPAQWIWGIRRW
jgi:hypothetical protein